MGEVDEVREEGGRVGVSVGMMGGDGLERGGEGGCMGWDGVGRE